MRRLCGSSLLLALFGLACQPPSAGASTRGNFDQAALVVDATADADHSWAIVFEVAEAPADEYFVFASPTAPTTADLGSFDPDSSCRVDCTVPGIGTYVGRARLTVPGKLTVHGSASMNGLANDAEEMHFTLVRKSDDVTPLAVTAGVGIEGGTGCGNQVNPDPPVLKLRSIAREAQ